MYPRIAAMSAAVLVTMAAAGASAQPSSPKGVDAMGDKDRPSADGWVQAPIPRTDAPSGKTPGEDKANKSSDASPRPVPNTGKALSAGQDPGTPMPGPANGPAAHAQ